MHKECIYSTFLMHEDDEVISRESATNETATLTASNLLHRLSREHKNL